MLPLTHNNMPIEMAIGMGIVPDMKNISIFGSIRSTSTTRQLVWELGGQVVDTLKFPAVATTIYASSSNIADTSTFVINYLDANYKEIHEEITLNGQTGVQLSVPALRINRVYNSSQKETLGDVYFGSEASPAAGIPILANTMEFASLDKQTSSTMAYTVPEGHSFLVSSFSGGNTRNEENDLLGHFTIGNNEVHIFGLEISLTAAYVDLPIPFFSISEKSDLVITTQSENINPDFVRGNIKGILVNNRLLNGGA